jgi:hypothetical protein
LPASYKKQTLRSSATCSAAVIALCRMAGINPRPPAASQIGTSEARGLLRSKWLRDFCDDIQIACARNFLGHLETELEPALIRMIFPANFSRSQTWISSRPSEFGMTRFLAMMGERQLPRTPSKALFGSHAFRLGAGAVTAATRDAIASVASRFASSLTRA